MADREEYLQRRMEELAQAAFTGNCYYYTDFLSPAEQSDLLQRSSALPAAVSFSGGYEAAERRMAVFGSPETFGYPPAFPITILEISPLNAKFSDVLTHRDFLGAVLNLGIDRRLTGDILTNGTGAVLFAQERIAAYITESLIRVKHTAVSVRTTDHIPDGLIRVPERICITVPSLRADAVIARLYHLSRNETQSFFRAEKVFVNYRLEIRISVVLKEKDLVSVRGLGRFRYLYDEGDTRKGNRRIAVERF